MTQTGYKQDYINVSLLYSRMNNNNVQSAPDIHRASMGCSLGVQRLEGPQV